jgi:C-terminal binding protein
MTKIAITDYFQQPSVEEIGILGDLVSVNPTELTEVLLVWHAKIDREYVSRFPNLRGVQRYGVGFDTLDIDYLKSVGILCANNPDYGVNEVSDTALAFILNISRGISRYDFLARGFRETWQENVLVELRRSSELTVGVVGAGRIGSSVLLKCRALGFRTAFYDPYKESGHEKVLGAERFFELPDLLKKSDIVSLHCPLNSETSAMVDADFLSQMKPGAALVNTARGKLIAEINDIYEALATNHLSGVALDVLPSEPPEANRLISAWRNGEQWLAGRLLINPHSSFYSEQAISDMRITAALNALRMLNREMPLNLL